MSGSPTFERIIVCVEHHCHDDDRFFLPPLPGELARK
jgi:hypothetical protein